MDEKIRNHITMLFESAPKTRKAFELKEELLANSEERFQDLVANGVAPEDAIKNVINSIGNVSELFQGLEEPDMGDKEEYNAYIKKAAIYKTIAAGIYAFSIVIILYFIFLYNYSFMTTYTDPVMLGIIVAILIDIIPTCMLVYITNLAPKYKRMGDTVVDDFKEWQNKSHNNKSIKGAVSAVLWTGTIFLYFAISILTMAWYATWIIFFIAICLQTVIELIYRLKE